MNYEIEFAYIIFNLNKPIKICLFLQTNFILWCNEFCVGIVLCVPFLSMGNTQFSFDHINYESVDDCLYILVTKLDLVFFYESCRP